MAEISEKERAKIHETATKIERCERDIQKIFEEMHQIGKETIGAKNLSSRNHALLQELIADKQGIFKWAIGIIAAFVLSACVIALGISNFSQ